MDREEDYLWLCAVPDLTWKEKMTLLHYFGSVQAVRRAKREEFADWEKLGLDWVRKLYPCLKETFLEETMDLMKRQGVSFVSRYHPEFPKRLRNIADCPYGLFYKGRLPATAYPLVGIVGARACSAYGSVMAKRIGEELALRGMQVVSGMAMGIDGIAQKAAAAAGGASFAVLGCGPERCYPQINIELYTMLQEKGGVLSEYPCGTGVRKYRFPERNRIISGLCSSIAVLEAGERSGSLITARQALEQGRDVYALPGRISDPLSAGCNALIRDGAGVITSAEEFADALMQSMDLEWSSAGGPEPAENAPEKKENPEKNSIREGPAGAGAGAGRGRTDRKAGRQLGLAPDDELVYSCIDLSPVSRERLSEISGLSIGTVMSSLLRLQLKDLVAEVAKNQFIRQR